MHKLEERFPQLWAFLERLSVLVIASLLFWLFSGLIITMPAALAGAFAAVTSLVRPGSADTIYRFWRGFRRNLVPATLLGLLNLVLGLSVYLGFRLFWGLETTPGKAMAVAYGSVGLVLLMVNVFAWPLLVWYPQPLGQLLRRSFMLAGAHPLRALGAAGSAALAIWLMLLLPGPILGILPAIGPGLAAALISYNAWQAMKRYVSPDDEIAE